jgi:hypothetical protein
MSANFYINSARMLGVDFHNYQTLPTSVKEIATGHRLDDWPYVVTLPSFSLPGGDDEKRTETVTADGEKMILDGFVHRCPLHIPLALLPPHPYEVIEATRIQANAQTTPLLKAPTVTSEGTPLAVCAIGALGFDLNCQDAGMKMTGIVICRCSVKTKATQKDLIFRLFDEFFKKMIVKQFHRIFETALAMAKRIPKPIQAILVWIYDQIVNAIISALEAALKALWSWAERSELPEPKAEPEPEPKPTPKDKDLTPEERERFRQMEEEAKKKHEKRERQR